jgi:hypothetical protein
VEEKMSLWNMTESLPIDQSENEPSLEDALETRPPSLTYPKGPEQDFREYDYTVDDVSEDDRSPQSEAANNGKMFDNYAAIPNLLQAWSFIFGSDAFDRLLKNIRVVSTLTSRQGETIEIIRNKIIETLSRNTRPRSMVSSQSNFSSFFQVTWNPLAFLEEYDKDNRPHIRDVITLNGKAIDAQAATCGQYVQQVWLNTGLEILDAVQEATSQPGTSHIGKFVRVSVIALRVGS